MTRRHFMCCLLGVPAAFGAGNVKLYLTDGTYHLVREYQVLEDRVRFYSVERSQWEEIPKELVDLEKTRALAAEQEAALEKEEKLAAEERALERQIRGEVAQVPEEPGVYLVEEGAIRAIPAAQVKIAGSKGREIAKILTPVPIIAGKYLVELDGARSANVVKSAQPEFYFRLSRRQRFALFRLQVKKDVRVVQTWQVAPVADQVFEEQEEIELFRKQAGEQLYKVWPIEPLPPGEYALVEYSQGERNIQVWDFTVPGTPEMEAAAPAAPAGKKKRERK